MATPTPVLGLKQYEGAEDMDFTELNSQFAQLDTVPPTVCTSGTRPGSNLYQGRMIYETDTKAVLMWDSTGVPGWRYIKPGSYKNYAANWSSPTTLSVGSAAVISMYRQLGDHVDFTYSITRAADTNVGAAEYQWDLPVPAATFNDWVGNGLVSVGGDAAGARSTYPVYIFLINSTTMVLQRVDNNARITNATKNAANTVGWSVNDKMTFRGAYRAAASV